jgi:flagellar basal-body rod modification protein FlgD
MTTTTGIANDGTAAAVAAANASSANMTADTQDRFLTLLVTQLQNQDPLNPMDNAEVTSQIAQLSTVNGINQLNNTLLALTGQMDVSQTMQAANLIGKGVLVPGTKIKLGSDPDDPAVKQTTPFGVDVISAATDVKVTVMDASGKAVRQIDLGPLDVGVHPFSWDGKGDGGVPLPDGAYHIKVTALDAQGKPTSADALTYGQVTSVQYAATGPKIDLGLDGSYSLLDIRKIMS